MESHDTPSSQGIAIWREAWEKNMAQLSPYLREPFPDGSVFSIAEHAGKIIQLLKEHHIACCVIGTQALCYYGAGRLCTAIEFCVPTEQLSAANAIFATGRASKDYTAWRGLHPNAEARLPGSLYHTFPRYRLNHDGPLFDFYLIPSIDWRFDCVPENFEYSAQRGIPYPKLHLFAQSLLERQNRSDLQDLVDGMDLTEEWGEENLNFDGRDGYVQWVADKNEKIRAALPQRVKDEPFNAAMGTVLYELRTGLPTDFGQVFTHLVRTKEGRIGPEHPPGYFVTKYRAVGSPDPRSEIRFNV